MHRIVHDDNGTLHRDVTLEHAQHALEDDDPELLRLVGLYGAGEAAKGGGGAPADSARLFHGTFERAVPNDFGNAGICVRCSSPVGQTIVYCEQFRAVADAPDLFRRSQAALDALLEAICAVIEDRMSDARDRPAQQSLIHFLGLPAFLWVTLPRSAARAPSAGRRQRIRKAIFRAAPLGLQRVRSVMWAPDRPPSPSHAPDPCGGDATATAGSLSSFSVDRTATSAIAV